MPAGDSADIAASLRRWPLRCVAAGLIIGFSGGGGSAAGAGGGLDLGGAGAPVADQARTHRTRGGRECSPTMRRSEAGPERDRASFATGPR